MRVCAIDRTQQAATTDDTIAWPPGVTGYASGKINACCLVLFKIHLSILIIPLLLYLI